MINNKQDTADRQACQPDGKKEKVMRRYFPMPLYHGSNDWAFNLSDEERKETLDLCIAVSGICFMFLENHGMHVCLFDPKSVRRNRAIIGRDFNKTDRSLRSYGIKRHGSHDDPFKNFYLTDNEEAAKKHAKKSGFFGETGMDAMNLLNGARKFPDFEESLDEKDRSLIASFESRMAQNYNPIIAKYTHVPCKYILDEYGEPLDPDAINPEDLSGKTYVVKPETNLKEIPSVKISVETIKRRK